jgi:hypothetical protein
MSYGTSLTLGIPFADAASRVRAALQQQGFGVLTEIDVTADRDGGQRERTAGSPPAAEQASGLRTARPHPGESTGPRGGLKITPQPPGSA